MLDNASQFEVDNNQIETLIENNKRYTTKETVDILRISKSSIENHLHQLDYVNRFVWVPHKKVLDCISACDSLLKHNKSILFLNQIVMDNEEWILYNNVEWKTSWSKQIETPTTSSKGYLVYMVELEGVLYYELLLENQMINYNKYCSQLDQVRVALNEK